MQAVKYIITLGLGMDVKLEGGKFNFKPEDAAEVMHRSMEFAIKSAIQKTKSGIKKN